MIVFRLFFSLCFSFLVYAQTQTIVDEAGQSVVVVGTLDPAGLPVTQTIETLPAGGVVDPNTNTLTTTEDLAAATTTTPTTTPTPPGQGPVDEPAATTGTPFGPTPFTYTTEIDGVTTAVLDTFSPTDIATTPFTPTASGTVWEYSDWLSSFGGSQATAAAAAGSRNAGHRLGATDAFVMMMMTTCLFSVFHLL
ncbi:hypothetical protein Agabi119p4_5484 [Agaricus bisporus var. burnettii]|uniref:Uncharacterized protein n=1 Tax=Agaricus bisporus var. burnettii TaxID=192524 RepID=A0A8H7F1S1_AGABI|nr:hypothetical protein Agabi119p4_5484 [Agaricus bisporus var. burnettii]